jgi:BMFP domain-containing protein YqiC
MHGIELTNHLRLLSGYHLGTDLIDRLTAAERFQKQQREALAQAADEIERLTARVVELEHMLADDGELPASAVPGLG